MDIASSVHLVEKPERRCLSADLGYVIFLERNQASHFVSICLRVQVLFIARIGFLHRGSIKLCQQSWVSSSWIKASNDDGNGTHSTWIFLTRYGNMDLKVSQSEPRMDVVSHIVATLPS